MKRSKIAEILQSLETLADSCEMSLTEREVLDRAKHYMLAVYRQNKNCQRIVNIVKEAASDVYAAAVEKFREDFAAGLYWKGPGENPLATVRRCTSPIACGEACFPECPHRAFSEPEATR